MWVADLRGAASEEPDPTEEPWVTGSPATAQRVPGIDEAPETKYVDPAVRPNLWRPALIGVGVGLVVTAIVGAIVVSARSTDDGTAQRGPRVTSVQSSSTTRPSATSTTVAPTPASTPAAAPGPVPGPAPVATPAVVPSPAPAPARVTADPSLPLFVDRPLPNGVSGTITSCAWQPTNGGQYEAAGTITNSPTTNKPWTVTMHWLQAQREIATQSTIVTLGAGQSKPWAVTHPGPNPPADPFSCSLTAS
jgi:hypothetical protein